MYVTIWFVSWQAVVCLQLDLRLSWYFLVATQTVLTDSNNNDESTVQYVEIAFKFSIGVRVQT